MISLEELSQDVACWRKAKKCRGERIPPKLLTRALELARTHGVEAVARSGSFTREQLQKAMSHADHQKRKKRTETPLNYGVLEVPAPESGVIHELELHFPSGAKLIFPAHGETAAMVGKFLCAYEGGIR